MPTLCLPHPPHINFLTHNDARAALPAQVGEDIQKASLDWKGLKITVKLVVKNRNATVTVVPSASSLVVRGLAEPERDRKKGPKGVKHTGNLTFDQVLAIARTMRPRSMAREMKGTVLEILGTCYSVGCTVNGEHPTEVQRKVKEGEISVPDK